MDRMLQAAHDAGVWSGVLDTVAVLLVLAAVAWLVWLALRDPSDHGHR